MFMARLFDWISDIVWKPIDKILGSKFLKWYERKIWNPIVKYWYVSMSVPLLIMILGIVIQ